MRRGRVEKFYGIPRAKEKTTTIKKSKSKALYHHHHTISNHLNISCKHSTCHLQTFILTNHCKIIHTVFFSHTFMAFFSHFLPSIFISSP
ncbi:hypothetical protein QVD17_17387 [Tagetes erecta]|uniref:Uncharacterized protein n=1 Tax=Tagetes erecta TaxID=13708 RepID=A0AAD8P1G5_TARER|nr:hypothetical protein QVD17_17387 [Tagetes erecta]